MDLEFYAKILKELGHPIRLNIFKILVKAGEKGVSVGTIVNDLNIPNSTLTHHLGALINANLIEQKREGRNLYCSAKYNTLNNLISFLNEECCIDESVS